MLKLLHKIKKYYFFTLAINENENILYQQEFFK